MRKLTKEEIKLRRELWWVYTNILDNFGKFDEEEIRNRLEVLRYEEVNCVEISPKN